MVPKVKLETPIEDIVKAYPEAVGFLTRKGIRCIRCGEPLWCSIGELLEEEKIPSPQKMIDELNVFLESLNN
jgi:hypothetical protein